jgi:hypothetical protein
LFKYIQEQFFLSIWEKQESKEYILDYLQEGILTLSEQVLIQKNDRSYLSTNIIDANPASLKVEYINKYLCDLLGIPQINKKIEKQEQEIINKILDLKIFQE